MWDKFLTRHFRIFRTVLTISERSEKREGEVRTRAPPLACEVYDADRHRDKG